MAELQKIVTEITVETADQYREYMVRAKQYNTKTRYISVLLTDNGKEYAIPNDAVLRCNFKKPDGHFCYNNASRVDGTNRILIHLTNQMLAAPGEGLCEVEIRSSDGEQILTSAVFVVEIGKGLYNEKAVESTDEMQALEGYVAAARAAANATAEDRKATAADAAKTDRDRQTATEAADTAVKARNLAQSAAEGATESLVNADKAKSAAETAADQAKVYADTAAGYAGAATVSIGWDPEGYFSIFEQED